MNIRFGRGRAQLRVSEAEFPVEGNGDRKERGADAN